MSINMRSGLLASAALGALALMPNVCSAQEISDIKPSAALSLAGEGSFFIDGTTHQIDSQYISPSTFAIDSGQSMINQMYVQFQKPSAKNGLPPIVFVHGCCLTSKSWDTTPDGRMGWYEYFTRKGFDTYLGEQVGRGRSGFDALQYQKVLVGAAPPTTNPAILIATDKFAWAVFRFGDFTTLTPFPDEKFPMQTVGVGSPSTLTFYNQVIPDLNSTLSLAAPGCADGNCTPSNPNTAFNTPVAMAQLANGLGGAILVGHSQSSGFPTMAALQNPTAVKGIIQLETGCYNPDTNGGPLTAANIAVLKKIPILVVVGDHFTTAQPGASCVNERAAINAAGGDFTFIALPSAGLHGNSHMMMLDTNNLAVADVIIDWIKQHVKGTQPIWH